MLRFPLNQKLTLITTAGMITCEIVQATNDFLFCKDVLYDGISLGKVYVDRKSVIAFSQEEEKKSNVTNLKAKIIGFKRSNNYATR